MFRRKKTPAPPPSKIVFALPTAERGVFRFLEGELLASNGVGLVVKETRFGVKYAINRSQFVSYVWDVPQKQNAPAAFAGAF